MFLVPVLSQGVWLSLSCCGGLYGPHGITPHHCALTPSGHKTKNMGFFGALQHVLNQPVMSVNYCPKKSGIKPSFNELQRVAGQTSGTWMFPPEQDMSLGISKDKFPVQWEILSLWKMVREHEEATGKEKKNNPWVKLIPYCAVALEFWDQSLAGGEDRTKPCEKSLFPLHFPT